MMPSATTGLRGRRGLVVGIASESSIAAAGATPAATYLDDKAQPFVRGVTDTLDCPLPCDVRMVGIRHARGRDDEVLRFAPGECFGQAGVLTGAATEFRVQSPTSSTVCEIAKSDIEPLLKARPAIAAALGQIMARRQAAWRDRLTGLDELDRHPETLAARPAGRIGEFLGLSA